MRPLVVLLAFLFAAAASAQTTFDRWMTVETPHFRFHYTKPYEAFALRVASRLEPIRDAVAAETGFAASQRTDVLIENPLALANGLTFPLLKLPAIGVTCDAARALGRNRAWVSVRIEP